MIWLRPSTPTQYSGFSPSVFDQVNWTELPDDDYEDTDAMDLDPFHPLPQTVITCSASNQQDPAAIHDYPALQLSPNVRSRFRARGIPATEWERFRPTIVQLYRDEDRQLEDVRRIMQERHLFYATVQMYKKRFAAWGIRKYYSQEQKEEVLLLQEGVQGTSSEICHERALPILLNSKPVKQHRIERYRRKKARCRNHQPYDQVSRFEPQHSAEYRNVELYLGQVKDYFAHCIEEPKCTKRLRASRIHNDFFYCIAMGARTLGRDQKQAFAWFNRACANVVAMLTEQCFDSMYDFLQVLGRSGRWQRCDDIRRGLLRYLGAAGRKVLGEHHPITRVVSILNQDFAWAGATQRAVDLVLATSKQHPVVDVYMDELLEFRLQTCLVYTSIGEFSLAVEEMLPIVKQCQMCYPPGHPLLQYAKYQLGYFYYSRKAFREAEKQWLEAIELCVARTERENGTIYAARSCRMLSWSYGDQGRHAEAERYLRLAVDGALELWGPTAVETWDYLEYLECLLKTHDRVDEVQLLRQQYVEVYAILDGYYLHEDDSGARFTEVD